MLDEWFENTVNSLCDLAARLSGTAYARLVRNGAGWHLVAFFVTLRDGIRGVLTNVRSEEDADLFLSEAAERLSGRYGRLLSGFRDKLALLLMIRSAADVLTFWLCLFLVAVSALGAALRPSAGMALFAAASLFWWASAAMIVRYPPLAGRVRQYHLAGRFLRACAFSCLLFAWFSAYRARGLSSNIILQSMMLITVFAHIALFLAFIAFNRRQLLFLRLLDAVLGVIPALAASAAVALMASAAGSAGFSGLALAALRAAGAALLFFADRIDSLTQLGSLEFKMAKAIRFLLFFAGTLFLLAASWYA